MLLQQLEALDKVESVPVKLPTCRCYRFFCMVNQLPVCCCFRSWKPWTRLSGRLSMWTTSNGACLSIRWGPGGGQHLSSGQPGVDCTSEGMPVSLCVCELRALNLVVP